MFDNGSPRRAATIGIVALVISVVSVLVSIDVHLGVPGADYTLARFSFPELNNVRQTNQVNIGGVRIGQVREVAFEDGRAVVTVQVDPDLTFHRDATARIENRSPLGQKMLEVTTGTPEAGELGDDVIAMPEDAVTTELDTVLGALDADSRAGLASTLRELGVGTAGHAEDVGDFLAASPDLVQDLGSVAGALAEEDQQLVALLANTERLASRFEGRTDRLEALVADAGTTLDALTVDAAQPLGSAIDRLPGTLETAEPAFAALGTVSADVRTALEDLDPGTSALGAAAGDLRGLLRESLQPLSRVPGVADDADPAVEQLTPVVADLRPLAPRTARALADGAGPAAELGPRHQDVAAWFRRFADALDHKAGSGNTARVGLVMHPSVVGVGVAPELLGSGEGIYSCLDPYPAPGSTLDQGGSIPTEGCP